MPSKDPPSVDRSADRCRAGRRSVLRTLAATGVAATASRFGAGPARGASPSSWDSGGDTYYSAIVDHLSIDRGLAPAEFVFADTEAGTIDHENVSTYTNGNGLASSLDVSGDDVRFTRATRFDVTTTPENKYDVALQADLPAAVSDEVQDGDVMLAVVAMRAPEGAVTTEYYATGENESTPWQPRVGAAWQRYFCPVEYAADAEHDVQFWFGFGPQTVDLGGFALLNFGQNEPFDALPSGAAGEFVDPYYDQLREDLRASGLPEGEFLFAKTEAGARDSLYEDAGEAGSVSSIDVAGDGVPFAVGKRYEVTSSPASPSDVQLYAAIGRPVAAGETMLGVAWLRSPTADPSVTVTAVDGDGAGNHVRENVSPSVSGEWTRHYFPIQFETDTAAGEAYFQCKLGAKAQTVDVGGVAVLSYGQDVSVSDLPSADGSGTTSGEDGSAGTDEGSDGSDDGSSATEATGPGLGVPSAVAAASAALGARRLAGRVDSSTDEPEE